jgi:hypothetical protein
LRFVSDVKVTDKLLEATDLNRTNDFFRGAVFLASLNGVANTPARGAEDIGHLYKVIGPFVVLKTDVTNKLANGYPRWATLLAGGIFT